MNCRATNERPTFIDRAASIRGVTRMEFVHRSSEAAATLNERPALDDETYDAFVIALDGPVKPGPNLKERFACSPLRERYPRQRQLATGMAFRDSTSGALGPNVRLRSKAERGQGRCTNLCDLLRRESNRVYGLGTSSVERRLTRTSRNMPETDDLSWTVGGGDELQRTSSWICWLVQLGDRCRRPVQSVRVIIVRRSTESRMGFYPRFGFRPFSDRDRTKIRFQRQQKIR